MVRPLVCASKYVLERRCSRLGDTSQYGFQGSRLPILGLHISASRWTKHPRPQCSTGGGMTTQPVPAELAKELRFLCKGAGIRESRLKGRLGPQIVLWCGVDETDDTSSVRARVAARLA